MRVIQSSVHASGRVRVWYQLDSGERAYATLEDQALTDGLLEALGSALEAAVRATGARPGRGAIHGRPDGSGAPTASDAQP